MNDTSMEHSKTKGPRRRRALLLLMLGIGVIVVLGGVRLRERLKPPVVIPAPPLRVEILKLVPQPFVVSARYSGSVEAEHRVMLAARLSSTLAERHVSEGMRVVEGQALLRLDATEQQQELQRLKAAADRIRADLDYWQHQLKVDQRLFKEGSITERNLQETLRQVGSLRASLEENRHAQATAKTRLGYAELSAPFSGIVQSIKVQVGEQVAPGQPLLELLSLGSLKAVISAPQSDRERLYLGLPVRLHLPRLQQTWSGYLDRILPALDTRSRNVGLEVYFPNQAQAPLYPGMSVQAEVELAREENTLSLPLHAVQQREGHNGVYLVKESRARWQPVETGAMQDGKVQLIKGVAAGDEVILTPYPALQPGSVVQVLATDGQTS